MLVILQNPKKPSARKLRRILRKNRPLSRHGNQVFSFSYLYRPFLPSAFFLILIILVGSAFLGSYGNAAGSTIQSGLAPVGKPLGKGLETVASPVGGLVEPLVGGIMKSGSAFGENFGTGAGNMDQKKKAEMEQARWVTSQAWANELFV